MTGEEGRQSRGQRWSTAVSHWINRDTIQFISMTQGQVPLTKSLLANTGSRFIFYLFLLIGDFANLLFLLLCVYVYIIIFIERLFNKIAILGALCPLRWLLWNKWPLESLNVHSVCTQQMVRSSPLIFCLHLFVFSSLLLVTIRCVFVSCVPRCVCLFCSLSLRHRCSLKSRLSHWP